MTTPKSPEQIMEELREITQPYCASGCGCFEDGIPGHEGRCVTKCSTFEEQKAWLRSSMASLLYYMAERMQSQPGDDYGYSTGIEKAESILIEEARKIVNETDREPCRHPQGFTNVNPFAALPPELRCQICWELEITNNE